MEALSIDPFDSNHWLYGTGATMYGGHDLKLWDTTRNVTLKSLATGIEETAIYALLSPPGGPPLLSAVADIGGFIHNSLDIAPSQAFHTPTYGTTHDIDYAGNSPANIVRTGESTAAIQIAVSNNYGLTWNPDYGGSLSIGPGPVAYSADATAVLLMSNTAGPLISRYTSTFAAVPSLPSGAAIASDKRNATVFYGCSAGKFYISSDIGVTFAQTASLGASTTCAQVRVHPTVAGDVWASTDTGLYHSTNYGSSFTQVGSGCTTGLKFALGAGSSSTAYPVIYGFFTVDGVTALFKTEDKGVNWAMISDASHGFGAASANVVGADMATYGRVYVGTNGRGIFYGNPLGALPPVTATGTGIVSPSTVIATASSSKTSSTLVTLTTSRSSSVLSSSTSTKISSTVISTSSKISSTSSSSKSTSVVVPVTSSMSSSTSSSKVSSSSTTSATGAASTAAPYGQCMLPCSFI